MDSLAGQPSLLRHRSFVLFWCARTSTSGAYQMQAVAVGWQLYDLTHDPLDLGLVGAQDPEKIRAAFQDFVRARVPADCKVEFGNFSSAPAFDVAFDNPALAKARSALAEEWGKKAVTVGAGGSIPIVGDFKAVLGMDTLMVGFALDDDRVHSPNEKFDLKCFHKGIRSWARILAALAE